MFTKFGDNRKRIIAAAQESGFKENYKLNAESKFFTYLTRTSQEGFSYVSVSYRKRNPMVEIHHRYKGSGEEVFQMVLIDKRAWQRAKEFLSHETSVSRNRKE